MPRSTNRQQILKTALILSALPAAVLAVKTVVDLRKGAAGTPANIVITSEMAGRNPSILWQNLAQGGEEATDMVGPVISKVKTLSPNLIRIDHLFDYYNVRQSSGNYDFTKLDQVISSIIATGAKPLLSLSYTTADMATNSQNAGEPKDWNDWYNLVKTTANRYSVQKNIDGIYYEVWNEPDLFGGWHYGKNPNYINLYLQTARAVRDGAAGTNFKIGGPATTAFYANWIKSLAAATQNSGLPLDFISWHRYSKNMDDFEKDINSLTEIMADYPQISTVERLITEVGPNPEPDTWYDNSLSGIHLISLSTRLAGKVHRIFPFEIVDGPTKRSDVSSGWGLLTHPSAGTQIKPRYQAIQFLNRLQGNRMSSWGDGSWVTALASKYEGKTQLILVNYDPRGQHTETVPVSFQGLSPGDYKITTSQYLGSTSNRTAKTLSSVLNEKFYLEPNTAIFVELSPLN